MSRGNWHFVATVIGYLIAAALIWTWLRPAWPVIPTAEYQKAESGQYSPGSPYCYPSRLDRLTGAKGADERYRCEQGAEEHRLKGDDLVQQTRSADAAVEIVSLTYRQTVIALAGTILTLLTLIAAFYAAWYSRRASEEGGRSAKAAEDSLFHARQMAHIELRAYLDFDDLTIKRDSKNDAGLSLAYNVGLKYRNFGHTPASSVQVKWAYFVENELPSIRNLRDEPWDSPITISPSDWHQHIFRLVIRHEDRVKIKNEQLRAYILLIVTYKDVFGKRHWRKLAVASNRDLSELDGETGPPEHA